MSYPKHYVDEIKAERDALKAKLQAAERENSVIRGEAAMGQEQLRTKLKAAEAEVARLTKLQEVAPERTNGRACEDLEINQGKLVFDGFLDHQDELEIWSDWESVDLHTFISRSQARSIIFHLQQVFNLTRP